MRIIRGRSCYAQVTTIRAHLEKVFQQRREAALKAMGDAGRQQAAQAAATSSYWLAELGVPQRPS